MGAYTYIVTAFCALLLGFAGWQELRRANKKYLPLRLLAVCFAIVGLACLGLPINTQQQVVAGNEEAVIETSGALADSIGIFLQHGHNAAPVYTWDEYTLLEQPSFNTLHVFGYGLSESQLKQLKGKQLVFHPASIKTGITSASWGRVLHTGEQLVVQGSFVNNTPQKIILVLNGLNTVLDSATIPPNTKSSFSLSTTPKNEGKAVYNLAALAGNKTIEEELLPIDVCPRDSLAVLVLAASPDFENRFLKDWLSQNAFSVAMRTAISKGKYGKWFFNMDSLNLDKITAPLLDKFDVLITDASANAALSAGEEATIRAKLEAGMGLLVKADTLLKTAFFAPMFPLYTQQVKQQQISVKLNGTNNLYLLHGEPPPYIKDLPGTQGLASDSAGQILAATGLYGQGRLVLTTINNAYEWLLAGNTNAYQNYLGMLLNNAAKKHASAVNIGLSESLPRIHQPLLVNIETGNPMPIATIGENGVYLRQDLDLPFLWQGSYWPVKTGWQTITVNNSSTDFYVYDSADWKYVAAAETLASTNIFTAHQEKMAKIGVKTVSLKSTPVPKVYFFLLFVLSCVVLWVERKFNAAA